MANESDTPTAEDECGCVVRADGSRLRCSGHKLMDALERQWLDRKIRYVVRGGPDQPD